MASNYLNYYELLKVNTNASTQEILAAYKKRAIEYHPDKNGGHTSATYLFQMIQEAKDTLTDPNRRLEYDYHVNIRKRPDQQTYQQQQYSQQTQYYYEEQQEVKPESGWKVFFKVVGSVLLFIFVALLMGGNSNNKR